MPLAIVLADFVAECEEEISATEGTIVELISYEEDEWSEIIVDGVQGIFPSSYLELYEEEEVGEEGEGDQEYEQENGEENYDEYDQNYDEGYENDDANNYDYGEGEGEEEQQVEPPYEEPVEEPIQEETPPPEPVVQPSPTLARESSVRNVGRPLPVPQGPAVQIPPKEEVKLVVSTPPAVNVQQVKETGNNATQLQPNTTQPRQPSPQRNTNSPGPVRGGAGGPMQPNRGSPAPGQRGRGGPAGPGPVAGGSPSPAPGAPRGGSNRGGPGASNPTARPLPTPTGPPATQQDKAKAGAGPNTVPGGAGGQGAAPAGAPRGNLGPRGAPGGAQAGQVRGGPGPGPNRGQRGGPGPNRGGAGPVQRGGPGPVRGGPGRGAPGARGGPGPGRGGPGAGGAQRGGPIQRARGGPVVPKKVEKAESESESDSEESVESNEQSEDSPEEQAAKAESDAKHRANVIAELITTEKDYVKDLLIIEEVFSKPLRQQQIIPEDDLTLLFSNLSVIITVNTKLLGLLTADEQDSLMVGAIFCQMADFLKMYTDFCANQPKLTTALDRLQKNPTFASFLAQCMTNEECRGLTLFSFLIKPIQRICKYPLLLKDLLKHTPSSHSDYEKLESALQKIEFVVSYVNERKRIAENLQKIIDVKDQIESTEELNLVEPSRRFVREGSITVIEKGRTRTRKTFVFNDLIVLTKERKSMMGNVAKDHFKAKFFLNDIKIVDIADTEEIKYACDVRPKDETKQKFSFVFVFPSAKEKSDWVKEIKLLVKQFQKKAAEAAKKAQAARAEAEALGIPYEDPAAFHLDDHPEKDKEKDKKEKEKADKKEEKEKAVKEVKPDKKASGSKRSQFGSLRSTKTSSKTKLPKIAPLGAPPPHAGAVAVYARPPPPKGHQLTRTATPQKNSSSGIFKIFGGDGKDAKVKKTK